MMRLRTLEQVVLEEGTHLLKLSLHPTAAVTQLSSNLGIELTECNNYGVPITGLDSPSSEGMAGRRGDMTLSSTTTSTSTTVAGIHTTGAPAQGTPCLLIRTELCGKTLKKWLETHDWKKRRRSRLFSYFEQVTFGYVLLAMSIIIFF